MFPIPLAMQFFYVILAFLALLALCDLFIGVSNDAVNFLNSAIGSRIARMRTILIVASLGVLLGATFSSGMMTIARSGVMHPQYFAFATVMFVFLAVMVSDVLLINTFNSLGLPTSTTVSIIFELLGASTAAAIWTLMQKGGDASSFLGYLNTAKALAMISTILVSVVIAFFSGVIVQYLARLVFSFHYEGAYKKIGGIFGGFCLTAICYFLVMKGAAGSSFMRPEWIAWIEANTSSILLTLLAGFTVLFYLLIWCFNVNVFRIIILAGTFSLAFAFAGNDLVNFVGVPIAALDSVRYYVASGSTDPSCYLMKELLEPAKAATYLLLFSGLVMSVTLWTSKKAMKVLETSVKLSSSQSGEREQFGASTPARMIVRFSMALGKLINQFIPGLVKVRINNRFVPVGLKPGEEPLPFDYVRATVNLVLSAILISSATALQLPLSTTYVTFMVAMGSSFADRAWDRETAVYRISGVLAVVSGWFITAFCAFTFAALVCAFLLWGGNPAAILVMLVTVVCLWRSNRKKDKMSEEAHPVLHGDAVSIRDNLDKRVPEYYGRLTEIYAGIVTEFFADDDRDLKVWKNRASKLFDKLTNARRRYYYMGRMGETGVSHLDMDARWCYYRVLSNMRENGRSLQSLADAAQNHVANRHRIFAGDLEKNIAQLAHDLQDLGAQQGDPNTPLASVADNAARITSKIDAMQETLVATENKANLSLRGCEIYLNYLQFARDLVSRSALVAMLLRELNQRVREGEPESAKPVVEEGV